ncbi:MAG: ABC transporter permease [Burkholderiales bacterium]
MIKRVLAKIIKYDIATISVIFAILLAVLIATSNPTRLGFSLTSISKDVAIYAIVGMAQMATLAVGQFNLAVGAIGGASAMVCGYLINLPTSGNMEVEKYVQAEIGLAVPWVVGVLVGLAVGLLLGVIQGWLITKTKINPFIISLALISVIHGLNMGITENIYFRRLPEGFTNLNNITIPQATAKTGQTSTFGFPLVFIITIAIMVIIWLLYNRTALGRKMLATGVSKRAADFAGINSNKYVMYAHALSGLLCALAGMFTASKLSAAQTSTGDNWLLYSFAAPILGGTLLNGGKVAIIGTMIGAGIMTIITTVLAVLKLDAFTHQIFIGGILLLAFILNRGRETLSKQQDKALIENQESAAAVHIER